MFEVVLQTEDTDVSTPSKLMVMPYSAQCLVENLRRL